MEKELVWNVHNHKSNKDEIEEFNIFHHTSFNKNVKRILKSYKKSDDKESFAKEMDRELHYYFWSKCEWEVIITKIDGKIMLYPWIGSKTKNTLDVTNDKDFNWIEFYEDIKKRYLFSDGPIKIDAYDQIRFCFDEFIDYCWNNR